ncbi:MAG: hypothetical protein R3B72_17715 [Polyangiaceae bacterium]
MVALTPRDHALYERQILLPGVGLEGQARVLSAAIAIEVPDVGGLAEEVARSYAQRAGFRTIEVTATEVPGGAEAALSISGARGPQAVLAGSRAALRAFREVAVR